MPETNSVPQLYLGMESLSHKQGMIFANLSSAYAQLIIVVSILALITLSFRLSSARLIQYGFYLLILWVLYGAFRGVLTDVGWSYYLHFTIAAAIGYAIWIGLWMLCEKWGKPYYGDGGLGVLAPIMLYPPITGFAMITKLGVNLLF